MVTEDEAATKEPPVQGMIEQTWTRHIRPILALQIRALAFLAAFFTVVFALGRDVERIGDRLQVLLPITALGCAIADGRGVQFFGRYLLLEVGIKVPKFALGDAPMNQRPSGGTMGFPSGHTAAATFGVTSMAATCMSQIKVAQGIVLTSAAFVGGSRVEARRHTLWQALAGGLWGWFVQAAGLVAFDRWFRRVLSAEGQALRQGREAPRWGLTIMAGIASTGIATGARAQMSIEVYSGWQTAPHSAVSGADPVGIGSFDFRSGWDGRSGEAPPYYGIRGILWQSPVWGYTADFNHTKVYADAETLGTGGSSGGFEVLEFTDGLNALTFGVIRQYPDAWGRVTPYWGLGLGVAIPHVEVQTTAASPQTRGYQIAGPAASAVAGAYFSLSDHTGVFAEYKGTYSQLTVDLDGGGTLSSDILTNSVNIGMRYTFN